MDDVTREKLRRFLRHDARGPIAVVLGQCEVLSEGLRGPLSPGQLRSVEAIRSQMERLCAELDTIADETLGKLPPI